MFKNPEVPGLRFGNLRLLTAVGGTGGGTRREQPLCMRRAPRAIGPPAEGHQDPSGCDVSGFTPPPTEEANGAAAHSCPVRSRCGRMCRDLLDG